MKSDASDAFAIGRHLIGIAIFFIFLTFSDYSAAKTTRALVTATAYDSLAEYSEVLIRPTDATDLNHRLQQIFEAEFVKRGYWISDKANLVATFSSIMERNREAEGGSKRVGVHGEGGSEKSARVGASVSVPLSNTKAPNPSNTYRLQLELHVKPHYVIWKGLARARIETGRDAIDIFAQLANFLTVSVGESFRDKAFFLQ